MLTRPMESVALVDIRLLLMSKLVCYSGLSEECLLLCSMLKIIIIISSSSITIIIIITLFKEQFFLLLKTMTRWPLV